MTVRLTSLSVCLSACLKSLVTFNHLSFNYNSRKGVCLPVICLSVCSVCLTVCRSGRLVGWVCLSVCQMVYRYVSFNFWLSLLMGRTFQHLAGVSIVSLSEIMWHHTYHSNSFKSIHRDSKEHGKVRPSRKSGKIFRVVNVPDHVLKDDNQGDSAADVSRNGEWHQCTKITDERQEDYGKEKNRHPRLNI